MPSLPDDNDTKERLSLAFLRTVSARCRAWVGAEEGGDYGGIDAMINSVEQPRRVVAVQLKSTSNPVSIVGNDVAWPLPIENYDHLRRTDASVPQILVVVQLAGEPKDWVTVTGRHLVLRRTAWWTDLWGAPASSNATSVTVHIPKRRIFTPKALARIFDAMGQTAGGAPRKPLHAY